MGRMYSVARGLLWNLTAEVLSQFWKVGLIGSFLLAECITRTIRSVAAMSIHFVAMLYPILGTTLCIDLGE